MNKQTKQAKAIKRNVMTNAQVIAAWTAQTLSHGTNSSGSLYFDGRTLYSYGRHFVLAHWLQIPRKDGIRVLINASAYSAATARHARKLRVALNAHCAAHELWAVERLTDYLNEGGDQ